MQNTASKKVYSIRVLAFSAVFSKNADKSELTWVFETILQRSTEGIDSLARLQGYSPWYQRPKCFVNWQRRGQVGRLWCQRPTGQDHRTQEYVHRNAILDGSRGKTPALPLLLKDSVDIKLRMIFVYIGDRLRRESGRNVRQSVGLVESGHHCFRNGRVSASFVWHAPNESPVSHPPESPAASQVKAVELKV